MWMLLPKGVHREALKKGDIVFSAKQTEMLLKTGKAIGQGRAYADGTVGNNLSTHALGRAFATGGWMPIRGGSSSSSSSYSAPSNYNTSSSGSGNNTTTEDILKDIEKYYDWIAIRIDRLDRNTKRTADSIEDQQSLVDKLAANDAARKAVATELNGGNTSSGVIGGLKAARDQYKAEAEAIANRLSLSEEYRKNVMNGKIHVEQINDDNLRKSVEHYKTYYEKYLDAEDKILELQRQDLELALQRLEYYEENYDLLIEANDAVLDYNKALGTYLNTMKGVSKLAVSSSGAFAENYTLATERMAYAQQKYAEYEGELNRLIAEGSIKKGSNAWVEAQNTLMSYKQQYLDTSDLIKEMVDQFLKDVVDVYDGLNAIHQAEMGTYESQLNLRNAKGQDIRGNKSLLEDELTQQRNILNNVITQRDTYEQRMTAMLGNGQLVKYSDSWYMAQEELFKLNSAVNEATTAVIEFEDKIRDVNYSSLQYAIDASSRLIDRLNDVNSLYESQDRVLEESNYNTQITASNNIIGNLISKRNAKLAESYLYDKNSDRYNDIMEEVSQLDSSILKAEKDIESLKDSIYELRFKPFEEGIQKLKDIRDELSDIRDLMNEDGFLDKTGQLTDYGIAQLALMAEQMTKAKQAITDYNTAIDKLQKNYENGLISQKEFDEGLKEYQSNIRDTAKELKGYEDALIKFYQEQINLENKYLNEVISKRKEALQAKKDYYDYDRNIKDQTKDINSLKAQIAALEGSTSATAQAELKKLRADLAEAEENLDRTQFEHSIEMQLTGYDNFSKDLSDALEDVEYEITHSAEKQESIIQSMLGNIVKGYDDAFSAISDIVNKYGLNLSQSDISKLVGQNSGTTATTPVKDYQSSDTATGIPTNWSESNTNRNQAIIDNINNGTQYGNGVADSRKIQRITFTSNTISVRKGDSIVVRGYYSPSDAVNAQFVSKTNNSNATVAKIECGSGNISVTITGKTYGNCNATIATKDGSVSTVLAVSVVNEITGTTGIQANSGANYEWTESTDNKILSDKKNSDVAELIKGLYDTNNTEFVTNAYKRILGRNPDEKGLNNYIGQLDSGKKTREQVLKELLNSSEGQSKFINKTGAEIIDYLYNALLGRDVENNDIRKNFDTAWNTSDYNTRMSVVDGFINSPEFAKKLNNMSSNDEFLKYMYNKFLGRNPDSDGKQYWLTRLKKGESRVDVAKGIINSGEWKKKLGNISNQDFINLLYSEMLGRKPDNAGYMYWMNKLNPNELDNLIKNIFNSTEFNRTALPHYASGTRNAPNSLAWTQDGGNEFIVRKSDGAILTKLNAGDNVIPHNFTENLWKWGAITPNAFLSVAQHAIPTSNMSNANVEIHYDSLLTVNGDVSKETLPRLQEILNQAYKYTSEQMYKDARKLGLRR